MEIIKNNIFWVIFFGVLILTPLIRLITGRPYFLRSNYQNSLEVNEIENIKQLLPKVMEKAGVKNINFHHEENKFTGLVGFSMSSWSEYVEVKVASSHGKLNLDFKSVCAFPYQIFDWGKNKSNFRKFEKELLKVLNTSNVF